jgi:hypothetical protein
MHLKQGIKFLLETGKIAHIIKEIFKKKTVKYTRYFQESFPLPLGISLY